MLTVLTAGVDLWLATCVSKRGRRRYTALSQEFDLGPTQLTLFDTANSLSTVRAQPWSRVRVAAKRALCWEACLLHDVL